MRETFFQREVREAIELGNIAQTDIKKLRNTLRSLDKKLQLIDDIWLKDCPKRKPTEGKDA